MEELTKVTPEQAETAWRIYNLAFSISSLIMTAIFGQDPDIKRLYDKSE